MADLYDLDYLTDLFDRMAASYDRMNTITSFGFSIRWRKELVRSAQIEPGHLVVDLMCGRGECWPYVMDACGSNGKLIGIDLSSGMLEYATRRREKLGPRTIEIRQENALACSVESASADRILMAFGLKTLAEPYVAEFAKEAFRLLKPGGILTTVEVSDPQRFAFRRPYLFYLKRVVPMLGRIFLGDPECYRMLGIYTERFQGCARVLQTIRDAGFEAKLVPYFFGCATGIVASKPVG